MPDTQQRRMIESAKRAIKEYLRELDQANDPDLWEEAAAKLCDVLIVYRNGVREPEMAAKTDEQLAQLTFHNAVERFLLNRGSVSCSLREGGA